MYRSSAIVVANTFADIPFSFAKIIIFNIIVYFMTDLARNAGGFWTFHLFSYMAFLAMQGFFRTIGLLCVDIFTAFRLAVFCVPNMVQVTCFVATACVEC
jgi:ATP-binding cassette subfamily G (WHITE) protein 2 (SNQ2)